MQHEKLLRGNKNVPTNCTLCRKPMAEWGQAEFVDRVRTERKKPYKNGEQHRFKAENFHGKCWDIMMLYLPQIRMIQRMGSDVG